MLCEVIQGKLKQQRLACKVKLMVAVWTKSPSHFWYKTFSEASFLTKNNSMCFDQNYFQGFCVSKINLQHVRVISVYCVRACLLCYTVTVPFILFQMNSWPVLNLNVQRCLGSRASWPLLAALLYLLFNPGAVLQSFLVIMLCFAIAWALR